jgi:hypothetical protein
MDKLIAVGFLAVAILVQPTISHAGRNSHFHATEAQKRKPLPPRSDLGCKRYFALIGALVSVPCNG